MEKSFNQWRPDNKEDSDSSSCSDGADSESESVVLAPDSDSNNSVVKTHSSLLRGKEIEKNKVISSSSDEDSYLTSASQMKLYSIKSGNNSTNISVNSTNEVKLNSSDSSNPSSSLAINRITKKKYRLIIDSDEEEVKSMPENKCVIIANESEEDDNLVANSLPNKQTKVNLEYSSPFTNDNIYSSTKLLDNEDCSSNDTNNDISNTSQSNHEVLAKNTDSKNIYPTIIDLTSFSIGDILKKSAHKDEIQEIKTDDEEGNEEKKVVVIDSDSGEDKSEIKHVNTKTDGSAGKYKNTDEMQTNHNYKYTSSISSVEVKPKSNNTFSATVYKKNENDYLSRLESLKAEESKLKMQVTEVQKEIESAQTALKTANISALPDKGVRLQMFLKKQESKLRDLRYQQSTLANEILKLQFTSSNAQQQPKKEVEQKMFKLPSTNTDIQGMGKRAMETHRVQQSLTVDALRELHNSLERIPNEDCHLSDPRGLRVELMPHQKYALAWLLWRESEKPSGGILADDMGLGKTLTMLSLILKSHEETDDECHNEDENEEENSSWLSKEKVKLLKGNTLIICPASLLGQWEGEIQNKLKRGKIDYIVHHGFNREKKARRLARPDVVITTYHILGRDAENPEGPLFQIRWRRVILDEAHQIRNHKTKIAQASFQLKSKSRWALTGTPVHNKEFDLYGLLKFLRCSPFDDVTIWKTWVENRNAAGSQRLNTITKSLMLRRTKQGLQDKGELESLTERTFNTVFITLDKQEQAAYKRLLLVSKTLFYQFLHQKAEKDGALSVMSGLTKFHQDLGKLQNVLENHPELARLHQQVNNMKDVKTHDILVLLLRLRQFCCHPSLIKSMVEKDDVSSAGIEDTDGLDLDLMDKITRLSLGGEEKESEKQQQEIDMSRLSMNALLAEERRSSKLIKVCETLEEIMKSQDKAIVVSQWVSVLNIVHRILKEQNVKCIQLTGSVPVKDRAEIVKSFNRKGCGPRVMLLSLTAGGVGLNLIGANHLLLLDLHWNPQLETQACDRIYRVGQEKKVQIYKFVCLETIEERILKLQEKKLAIADGVLTGTNHATKLSLDDLKMMFEIAK